MITKRQNQKKKPVELPAEARAFYLVHQLVTGLFKYYQPDQALSLAKAAAKFHVKELMIELYYQGVEQEVQNPSRRTDGVTETCQHYWKTVGWHIQHITYLEYRHYLGKSFEK